MKQKLLALAIALSTSSVWAGGITTGLGLSDGNGAGFYAGASMGKQTGDVADTCDANEWDCYAWKLYGGYKFNQTFGVEGNYYHLLDEEVEAQGKTPSSSHKTTGYSVAATASMPVMEKAEVFGKLGMFSTETEVQSNSVTTTTDDKGALFGVGAGYKFTNNLGIRGEYEHFKGDNTSNGLLTGGVTFSTF
ncbi:MAG: porin family protein [Thiofilum sp.]|uniref:porin family protein n=1 Tax=Thiofilum sp. TaxID=2212733 RepID=UPI0025F43279|nr:porin family protein [Thiofilum sp.]MBK8454743.1 porin family protein [Thiofilum sp.]